MENDKPKVMVCVTRQKTCERLIRSGAMMAERTETDLLVVNVVKEWQNIMGSADESLALEMLFNTAKEHNAEMCVIKAKNTLDALAQCAQSNNVGMVIMGESPVTDSTSIIDKLRQRIPKASILVIESKARQENGDVIGHKNLLVRA